MKIVDQTKMIERAKSKKDGIYTWAGIHYRVRDSRITHYADFGTILESAFGFNCVVGSYEWGMGNVEGKKLLKGIK